MKTQIKNVRIQRDSGPLGTHGDWTFEGQDVLSQANDCLQKSAKTCPEGVAWDHHIVTIQWEDGRIFRNAVFINRESNPTLRWCIMELVQSLKALTSAYTKNCPTWKEGPDIHKQVDDYMNLLETHVC